MHKIIHSKKADSLKLLWAYDEINQHHLQPPIMKHEESAFQTASLQKSTNIISNQYPGWSTAPQKFGSATEARGLEVREKGE